MKTNSTFQKTFIAVLFIFTLQSLFFNSFATNYTWTGTTSTSWNTNTNWNPNGTPTTGDTVTIGSTTRQPLLDANRSIGKFTITTDTLNLNTFILTITGTATFTSGLIKNGSLTVSSTATTTFGGTHFSVPLNATSNSILLNGSVFDSTLSIVKKGTGNDLGTGKNIFNAAVTIIDSASGSITLANNASSPDTFNTSLTVKSRSTGSIYLAHNCTGNVFGGTVTMYSSSSGIVFSNYYGTATYNDNITVNSTSSGGIYFGYSSGSCTLASGKTIQIGSEGFSHTATSGAYGTLDFHNFIQADATAINLTLTGTRATLYFRSGCLFKGTITVSAPAVFLNGSHFNGKVSITETSGYTNSSNGGNYFADSVTIVNGSASYMTLGTSTADTFASTAFFQNTTLQLTLSNAIFNGNVTLKNSLNSLTDRLIIGNCTFKGTVTVDNYSSVSGFAGSATKFTGTTILDSSATLSLSSGFLGYLTLQNFKQYGSTTFSISMNASSSTNRLFLQTGNVFNAPFVFNGPLIYLNGSTFNNTVNITRVDSHDNNCDGGNVFNGTTVIMDSCSSHSNAFCLATLYPDTFNANVTFIQKGTTSVFIKPAYTKNTLFKGNVTVDGNAAIAFGANGGKVIFSGSNNQTLNKSASYIPTFKKIEVNKSGGSIKLNLPLTLTTDSLQLTKGIILTDTTNILSVPDNGIVTGGSDSSYLYGAMKKTGNDAFTFPLGDTALHTGAFHPLYISAPSSTSDVFTAQYFAHTQTLGSTEDTSIEETSKCEYWKLTRNTGSSTDTVKLGWNTNSCNTNGLQNGIADIRVVYWGGTKWLDKGNGGTTGNSSVGCIKSSAAQSSFGYFALANRKCSNFKTTMLVTNVRCKGNNDGSAQVTPAGAVQPYAYTWTGRTGGSTSLHDLAPGTYTVSLTDSRGCALNDTAHISEPSPLAISIDTTFSSCHNYTGTAKLAGSGANGGYTYFWVESGLTTDSIGNLGAGNYEVIMSDQKGCSLDTIVSISDSNGPSATLTTTNVSCNGMNDGSINISTTEPTYPPYYPCRIINPDEADAGSYRIMLTDSTGCTTILEATIAEPPALALSVSTTQSTCGHATGSATASVSGGTSPYTYSWSYGGTDSLADSLYSGVDTVTVTDSHGCSTQQIVTITDSNGPTLTVSVSNVSCFEGNNGSATVSVSGGATPYSYSWSDGVASATDTSLYAGTYTVIVTDANGCKKMVTAILSMPELLSVSIVKREMSSDSTNDALANALISGGTPPYSYLWAPDNQTTSSISGLGSGVYSITVTDANQCESRGGIIIPPTYCANGTGCNSHGDLICAYSTPLPALPSACTDCVLYYDIVDDFGADKYGTTSSECAFEKASKFINEVYFKFRAITPGIDHVASFTLNFPSGKYIVGRQDDFGAFGNYCWYKKGHNIFFIGVRDLPSPNDIPVFIHNLNFVGQTFNGIPGTVIKFQDCLKFGAFEPSTGDRFLPVDCPPFHMPGCNYTAYVGDLFTLANCANVSISGFELDGNVNNFSMGGAFDFQKLNHSAILLINAYNVRLLDIFEHDFAKDGLTAAQMNEVVWWDCIHHPLNLTMNHCHFNNNHRTGFAWTGGTTVNASNCEFNFNGQGTFNTDTRSGMDIEWDQKTSGDCGVTCIDANGNVIPCNGNQHVADGHFTDCDFKFNYSWGVVCNRGGHQDLGLAISTHDFYFTRCTFVGSETGPAMEAVGRNFNFICSDFYGRCDYAYDAIVSSSSTSDPNYLLNTKFSFCNFNEEYTDNSGTHSITLVECPNGIFSDDSPDPTGCISSIVYPHQYMANFKCERGFDDNDPTHNSSSRVNYNHCNFNTGYYNRWGAFRGSRSMYPINNQIFNYCKFKNTGLNADDDPAHLAVSCSGGNRQSLGYFNDVTFKGTITTNHRLFYVPLDARNYSGVNDCYDYFFAYAGPPQPAPLFSWNNSSSDCNQNSPFNPPPISPISMTTNCPPKYKNPDPGFRWQFTDPSFCDYPYYRTLPEYCIGIDETGSCLGYVSNACSCPNCEQQQRSFNPPLSSKMNEPKPKQTITAYPVPTSGYLHIENLRQDQVIVVYNLMGEELIRNLSNGDKLQLDLQLFPSGIYCLKIDGIILGKIVKL